ncbi:FecCD family ABC transporter permease [Oceanispirochaeta crateris]|uniref:FecCD family ABC transporter permease n=1 Tax=Oceanispirochaeta crateris TaxID=2518645 RepID=UPI001FEB0C3D|nr:iron ABC transporter permease [Oceanispirochaeta crateris]
MGEKKPVWVKNILLILLLVVLVFGSLLLGRYPKPGFIGLDEAIRNPIAWNIILNLRLPRIIAAVILGSTLALTGLVFQTILGNPLVEPGILGVSQGAAFGAGLMIVLNVKSPLALPFSAALFSLLALGLAWSLAKAIRFGGWIIRLILSGIIVSAVFSSGLGILKYLADPRSQLQEITFWMMGGLSGIGWTELKYLIPFTVPVLILIFILRWRLNLLSMGDRTAHSLGISPILEKNIFLFMAVLATAAVVSYCGIIGWIGLIIPHIARRVAGSDTAKSVPTALITGGIFALISDDTARTISTGEIPLGILTSLAGALIFTLLMVFSPLRRHL